MTDGFCYFRPFTYQPATSSSGNIRKTYARNSDYGFKRINDGLYNAFNNEGAGTYRASRAYNADFKDAMPSLRFAAEIFTSYMDMTDEEGREYTAYFVDETMNTVATTFYKGLGTDMQLYGMYASKQFPQAALSVTNYTPYVIVNDEGYIVSANFYYNLYYFYGVIEIDFKDFNTAELPDGISESDVTFETRNVPSSWEHLELIDTKNTDDTGDDEQVRADLFMADFFDDPDAASEIPFFGNALGDCFGFGMPGTRRLSWETRSNNVISLYYDVLLDLDYSIDSSIDKVEKYAVSQGYTLGAHGIYEKGDYRLQAVDNGSMDLYVYIWKVDPA